MSQIRIGRCDDGLDCTVSFKRPTWLDLGGRSSGVGWDFGRGRNAPSARPYGYNTLTGYGSIKAGLEAGTQRAEGRVMHKLESLFLPGEADRKSRAFRRDATRRREPAVA